jgi:hypothetical protein
MIANIETLDVLLTTQHAVGTICCLKTRINFCKWEKMGRICRPANNPAKFLCQNTIFLQMLSLFLSKEKSERFPSHRGEHLTTGKISFQK